MSSAGAERVLALALASSAGAHAALVSSHVSATPLLGALFALRIHRQILEMADMLSDGIAAQFPRLPVAEVSSARLAALRR